ncbi:hypothetical protein Acr_08g0009500 [Actinidia rufa]|uniref:Ripening-related protein 1 n=1 Tax=Actinidia rufa TaxID=165716 RepID=A0A7J0F1L0_9ERIC|nr:hypothetical protein Acr_08g0009500 [Actinidia rufa]
MNNFSLGSCFFIVLILVAYCLEAKAQACRPSGRIKGKVPPNQCKAELDSDCCIEGKFYSTYTCSPPVSTPTKAVLTLGSFSNAIDGGSYSIGCDDKYHSDDTPVVALSTGWYNKGERCLDIITISANGRSVNALVVNECDSTRGCDEDNDYEPPCGNNIVDASKEVWKALGVPRDDWGELDITWSGH